MRFYQIVAGERQTACRKWMDAERLDTQSRNGVHGEKKRLLRAGVPEAIVEILWAIGIIWESHQSLNNSSWFASSKKNVPIPKFYEKKDPGGAFGEDPGGAAS
jgi:hypothetical protein